MIRTFLISCLILLLPEILFSQADAGFTIRRYSTENGLPSNGIKGVEWDESSGFLWMATEAGVVRFNGQEFKTYTRLNTPGITTERMGYIIRNNEGKIFMGDLGGNLLKTVGNQLLFNFNIPANKPGNRNLFRAALMASEDFFRETMLHPKTLKFELAGGTFLPDGRHSFYYILRDSLYYYKSGDEDLTLINKNPLRIKSGFKIGDESFIMTPENQVYRLRNAGKDLEAISTVWPSGYPGSAGKNFRLFWESGMPQPVLVNENNAWVFKLNNGVIEAVLICNQIPLDAFIYHLQYSEKREILFLGTDSKGLVVISKNSLRNFKYENAGINQRNAYYSQVELSNGNVLTNEGHELGDAPKGKVKWPISGGFGFNIYLQGDTLLWYPAYNKKIKMSCLYSYNYRTQITTEYPTIIMRSSSAFVAVGKETAICNPTGIAYIRGDSLAYQYRFPAGVTDPMFYDMKQGPDGMVYLAGCAGFLRYDPAAKKLDTLFREENFCVRTISFRDNYILIGTYGNGFYIWKNGILKPMPLDKNKYLLYTHCFFDDQLGYCWISTNRGLFKVRFTDLLTAWEKNTGFVFYQYFGKNDGMEMTEMNGGCTPCALRLKNGNISFPTMDGLIQVDPKKHKTDSLGSAIYFDELIAGKKTFAADSSAIRNLSSNTSEVLVRLAFPAWGNMENIYVEYELNGSGEWITAETEDGSLLRLSGLRHGDYIVKIRKAIGFGTENYSYAEFRFGITTPWYNQWWFYLLTFLFAFSLFALFIRLRTERYRKNQLKLEKQIAEKTWELSQQNDALEKSNSLKSKLISIISHDIVTPLKFLTVAGNNLREKRSQIPEELQQETIREIANTSQELQLLSTNILNWIKYQHENRRLAKESFIPAETVNQVFGVLLSIAKQKNITLVNTVDPSIEIYQYYEPLKILVYNLVLNAINFSERGSVTVSAIAAENVLQLQVKDEGVGMTPDQVHNILSEQIIISSANIDKRKGNGLGYLIIKDLVKTTGSTLAIQSEKGKGTTVTITIPVLKPVKNDSGA